MNDAKPHIMSISISTKPQCAHANGWYKMITFQWWKFKFKKRVFLCTDCDDIIPLDNSMKVRNDWGIIDSNK